MAGIWRKTAIIDAGGWQHDTLTEDTDLSFRAQLMGWKFVYLLDEEAPAEIPVEINAFKAQQRRWAKGVMQVGIKLYPRIWLAPLPLRVKLEMFFRLTGNISYPLMILASFLQFPLLLVRYNQPFYHLMVLDLPLLFHAADGVGVDKDVKTEDLQQSLRSVGLATAGQARTLAKSLETANQRIAELKRTVHHALLDSLGPKLYDSRLTQSDVEQKVRQTLQEVLAQDHTALELQAGRELAALDGPLLVDDPELLDLLVAAEGGVDGLDLALDEADDRAVLGELGAQVLVLEHEAVPTDLVFLEHKLPPATRARARRRTRAERP